MRARWLLLWLLVAVTCKAQQRFITGYVADAQTGERLVGATVQGSMQQYGVITNQYGYFSLSVKKGDRLTLSFIGYQSATFLTDTLQADKLLLLKPTTQGLDEVQVIGSSFPNRLIGVTAIPIQQLRQIPMPMGEADVMKALAFTPGVTVGNEGTAGLLVRGGSPDQNLILLDDVPVYNQAHLFGFATAFNPDAIKGVNLYKGAFPARFGGRTSSVVDITMRDGNQYSHKKELHIGLLSSRLLLEGPLGKSRPTERPSYMVSARSSYFSLFLLPTRILYNKGLSESYFNYWFYDGQAKVTIPLSPARRLIVSLFRGHDYWLSWDASNKTEQSKFQMDWGNMTGTVRYSQSLRNNLFLTGLVGYTHYRYQTGYTNYTDGTGKSALTDQFLMGASVRDWMGKVSFDWHIRSTYQLRVGVDGILHRYVPSRIQTTFVLGEEVQQTINKPIDAAELAIYAEQEWRPTQNLTVQAGGRLVSYYVAQKNYFSGEPRFGLNWQLSHRLTLKGGYSTMRQFIHMLNANATGFPNDSWVPATAAVKPQLSNQLTVGLGIELVKCKLQLSVDAYYKKMRNLIDLASGISPLITFDQSWEKSIEKEGIGRGYGLECMLYKPGGRINGWIAYTYARSERRFSTINNGQWFRANYDRRHVANIVFNYKFAARRSASLAWQYQSGQPYTIPIALIRDPENSHLPYYAYGDRQRVRTWTLGVVNVYNRRNPLFTFLRQQGIFDNTNTDFRTIGYRSSLTLQAFFPVLPYLSYGIML